MSQSGQPGVDDLWQTVQLGSFSENQTQELQAAVLISN